MELEHGVYFQQYGDVTYLRHTGQRKDYLFGGSAKSILDYLAAHPGCKVNELLASLSDEYDLEDDPAFQTEVEEFVQQLEEKGILKNERPKVVEPDLPSYARKLAVQNHQLFSVTLELTYRCNERCVHCYVDDPIDSRQELSLAEYQSLFDELLELGCMDVLLTGGEVTMRKDFLEIAQCAVDKGLCVDIYTNGLSLSTSQIERLAAMGLNSVSFSLYGPDAESHDAITKIPGSFDRTMRSILMCKCAGIDVYAKTVVMKQNYDKLEELMRLGKLLGISINIGLMVSVSHGGKPADMFRLMDPEKYQKAIELVHTYDAEGDCQLEPEGHDPALCGAGSTGLSIDPYGNVMPCNAFHESMGNIRSCSLKEIWNDAPFLKTLSRLSFEDVCPQKGNCKYARWCSMCIGAIYSEHHTWTVTPDVCMMACGVCKANQACNKNNFHQEVTNYEKRIHEPEEQ